VEQQLQRGGIGAPDLRASRLVGLAAHKLLSDIASSAYERSTQRARAPMKARREEGVDVLGQKQVLTPQDVAAAAQSCGVVMRHQTHFMDER
jgi:hypothetical protein